MHKIIIDKSNKIKSRIKFGIIAVFVVLVAMLITALVFIILNVEIFSNSSRFDVFVIPVMGVLFFLVEKYLIEDKD